ncbi:hypothetical protein RN001_008273 [Aquatica leii]|uniref:Inter-alpha-trypsin inhibitor heavy chain H4-like n=1 Tax=Aquatica leii TaxID=1421715 RepID=A0AAN7SGI8_9COLE|nr:hypothetical protein RN001_008273 [Aquatica leii]
MRLLVIGLLSALIGASLIAPIQNAPMDGDQSLVVSSTEAVPEKENGKEGKPVAKIPSVPQIYEMHIRSDIKNRFSHTTVTSKVRNFADKAQEAVFNIVLPETAYISGFIMEVDGKNYTAYVKEKEEAKREYDQAISSGQSAAHVAVSARDSNRFTVSVNIEPAKKAAFYLSYEQLLNRQDGRYEQVVNIHPGQPVKDLSVEVVIVESRKLINLNAPPLRSGNEIDTSNKELDPRADIEKLNDTAAIVRFTPNLERQKQLAHVFGTKEDDGLAGQFIVQYDVERDPSGGEVLVQDGYFVHFFAPADLKPLPKQVVFILDTSGSMWGQKIQQLKEAMLKILDQLNEQDSFNLVEFNSNTRIWDLNNHSNSEWYPHSNNYWYSETNQRVVNLENGSFPRAYSANADNIKKAKDAVNALQSDGSTDMYKGLEVGLHLIEVERTDKNNKVKRQPIIIFLTDGEPTDYSTEIITTKTSEFNSGPRKAPIFALSFGEGADKTFLQKLSLRNNGFSRHIYEAADASLQLQDFYKQISSPLLSDVTFKYEPTITSLTKTDFPIHFGGSEIVIAGWCGTVTPIPTIDGFGREGHISLKPVVSKSISNVERLWAYLTISQLLEQKEAMEDKKEELKKKALEIALKYEFVTAVSSLVVVKPNETKPVDTEEAKKKPEQLHYHPLTTTITSNKFSAQSAIASGFGGAVAGFPSMPSQSFGLAFESPLPMPGVAISQESDIDALFEARPTMIPIVNTTTKSTLEVLLESLEWLKDVLTDGFVKGPTGTYKLGVNETISDVVVCAKTPLNQEGHCTLLHECPQVHKLLQKADDFFNHMCILKNEFAGVCCPNNP